MAKDSTGADRVKLTTTIFYPVKNPLKYRIKKVQVLIRIISQKVEAGKLRDVNIKDYLMLLEEHDKLMKEWYAEEKKKRVGRKGVEEEAPETGSPTIRKSKSAGMDF